MARLQDVARRLRAERKLLPRPLPFAGLLLRTAVLRRPTRGEASELARLAARVPRGAIVLQHAPAAAATTIELATGCRAGGARLVVHWPPDADTAAFADWHRAVITAGMLPWVEVASSPDVAGAPTLVA